MKEKDIELLNAVDREGLLNRLYVTLISSDSLTSADYCDKCIEILNSFINALPSTDIENKEYWNDKFLDGIKIAERDKKAFEDGKQ